MPHTEILNLNFKYFLPALLLITLFSKSIETWMQWWHARRARRSWLEWCDRPRTDWSRFAEQTTVVLTVLWLSLQITAKLTPAPATRSEPITTANLLTQLIVLGGIALMLPAILLSSHRPAAEFGLSTNALRDQIRDGVKGFLLSVLPMAVSMLLTVFMSVRNEDTQNPLLKLLTSSSNPIDIVLVCILAVVIAPLSEEMIFRVILQGWLTTIIRPSLAIPFVALSFAAIHGSADGIALLPLAAILGYVFYQRHSYVSVVVIHFLFNATMLVLQLLIPSKNLP